MSGYASFKLRLVRMNRRLVAGHRDLRKLSSLTYTLWITCLLDNTPLYVIRPPSVGNNCPTILIRARAHHLSDCRSFHRVSKPPFLKRGFNFATSALPPARLNCAGPALAGISSLPVSLAFKAKWKCLCPTTCCLARSLHLSRRLARRQLLLRLIHE